MRAAYALERMLEGFDHWSLYLATTRSPTGRRRYAEPSVNDAAGAVIPAWRDFIHAADFSCH